MWIIVFSVDGERRQPSWLSHIEHLGWISALEHREDHIDLRRLLSVYAQTVRKDDPQTPKNEIQNQVVINTCIKGFCSFPSSQICSEENVASFKIKLSPHKPWQNNQPYLHFYLKFHSYTRIYIVLYKRKSCFSSLMTHWGQIYCGNNR